MQKETNAEKLHQQAQNTVLKNENAERAAKAEVDRANAELRRAQSLPANDASKAGQMAAAQSRVSSAQGKLSSAQTALNQSKANRDKKAREFAAAKQAKQTASTDTGPGETKASHA